MHAKELKSQMIKGPLVVGGHVFLTDESISELMALSGYDFIWIDAEHGAFDRKTILSHIIAASSGGAASIVRVVDIDIAAVKPVLEMGPDGIIFPMVTSVEDAKRAIDFCRYPPKGTRGFGPRRAKQYGMKDTGSYLEEVDDSILKIIQIEHIDAVKQLDAILAIEGLDAIVIGPNDLSGSIGKLSQLWDAEVLRLCDQIIVKCKAKGIPVGISIGPNDPTYRDRWISQDIDFISIGDDISFLTAGARQVLDSCHPASLR
jgi:2-keto-3-deoxy-L-rhamnonate aldolase RhmA